MTRPRLLDLFCGAGGAAYGYWLAGWDVFGCDIEPQPHYPFTFHQYDALAAITEQSHRFDFIHASPPCQRYTPLNAYNHHEYPDLIAVTRELLVASGKPWVIENVPQAPLIDPVTLCGAMFGLKLYRHRLFEASFGVTAPAEPSHLELCARNGYLPTQQRPYMSIHGGKHSQAWQRAAAVAMGTPWMTTIREVCEAIPPAYTRHIGTQGLAVA